MSGADRQDHKRVLLVKLGAIGDVIMAIPAAAALHAEGCTIDWVASTAVAPLLRLYPWIYVIEAAEAPLLRGRLKERLRSMFLLWRTLRRRQAEGSSYDLVATLYYDRRYALLSLPLRPRQRISLSRTDRRTALLAGRHHTDEYARILLGRPDEVTPFHLEPIPVPALPPSPLPQATGRPRVVLVPAGARNALRDDVLRRWPVQFYVALAGELLQRGCEVVLVGGPEDGWASPHFSTLAGQPGAGAFIDAIGRWTLVETLSVMESAAVTVAHDTGPLHMAGITSTALVSIFGPTDPHGRLPRRNNTMAFWGGEGFACRPCYDGRDYAPCPQNSCMAQITPGMVLNEVLVLLEARGAGTSLPPRILGPVTSGLVRIATVTL